MSTLTDVARMAESDEVKLPYSEDALFLARLVSGEDTKTLGWLRGLVDSLMPLREALIPLVEKLGIEYCDDNDPQYRELWTRQADLLAGLVKELPPERRELLYSLVEARDELNWYYEAKTLIVGVAVGAMPGGKELMRRLTSGKQGNAGSNLDKNKVE